MNDQTSPAENGAVTHASPGVMQPADENVPSPPLAEARPSQNSSHDSERESEFPSAAPLAANEHVPPGAGLTDIRERLRRLSADVEQAQQDGRDDTKSQLEALQRPAPQSSGMPAIPAGEPESAADLTKATLTNRIMIVDDEETNVLTVQAFLQQKGYRDFVSVTDSRAAMASIQEKRPDVLLLDINMPHVTGIDILRQLKQAPKFKHIPAIVLTAAKEPEIKREALDLGAYDFLAKPVDPHDLIPRVRNALVIKSHMDAMSDHNERLEVLVQRRTEDLFNSRQQLILSLARAAEHRDDDTGNHVIRVGRYAGIIAAELGWSEHRVQMIEQAAQLHDVGKIGIPDSILFKPGKLDPQEWDFMRRHCAFGVEIIEPHSDKELKVLRSHAQLGADIIHIRNAPMMLMATRIAQTHHERWDGSGYPLGLAGEDIPIEGRITAVADVFDALSSARPYKKAFPREKCFEILREGRGSHFDPQMLDAFFSRAEEIVQVQLDLMDRNQ